MRIGIVGGKLQGTEAAYLARKAGWETILYDRRAEPPALRLCDALIRKDLLQEQNLDQIFKPVDFVLPALEDDQVLEVLQKWSARSGKPLAFDPAAYSVSSSKTLSNKLFVQAGIPHPKAWPESGFPVVAKASKGSGSDNVHRLESHDSLKKLTAEQKIEWVIQEWVEGPSFSLEVIGSNKGGRTYQVTALEMDAGYDCKRVFAPAELSSATSKQFEEITLKLCNSLQLNGIMDVEVIVTEKGIAVLEIDARLPSQTPTVVYLSTGINLLELLGQVTINPDAELPANSLMEEKGAVYEHIQVTPELLEVCGEHIMSSNGPLSLVNNFFGADEALTSYAPGKRNWVATLMFTGSSLEEARRKREETIETIMKKQLIAHYSDPCPEEIPHFK